MSEIGKQKRKKVYERFNGHCAYCGKPIRYEEMTIDHIKPKSKGGANHINNLFPSCQRCNGAKKALSVKQFRYKIIRQYQNVTPYLINNKGIDLKFYFERPQKKKHTRYFELVKNKVINVFKKLK